MGSRSKREDDKALVLCQERKRFVREALDGRCAFAAAHFAYIQSLRHVGQALRKFVEPEGPADSSLYTSTSATPEPPTIRQRSTNLSPSLSHHASDSFSPVPSPLSSGRFHINHMKAGGYSVTTVEEKLPIPVTATMQTSSPVQRPAVHDLDDSSTFEAPPGTPPWDYFGLFQPVENQISYHDEKDFGHEFENADDIRMLREKEGIPELEEEVEKSPARLGDSKRVGEDKAPYFKYVEKSPARAGVSKHAGVEKAPHFKDVEKSPTRAGDSKRAEEEKALHFKDVDKSSKSTPRAGDSKHAVEEKAPHLKDVEKTSMNGGDDDLALSEDDFENPTSESLVRMFKNRNDTPVENTSRTQSLEHRPTSRTPSLEHRPTSRTQSLEHHPSEKASEISDTQTERPKNDTGVFDISMYETDESPIASPVKEVASSVSAPVPPMNGKSKEPFRDARNVVRDLNSWMKEVEFLFIKASDAGKEVPMMLEADKINFRPLLPEEKAPGSTASGFFATLFACCREEVPVPQPPPQAEVKYLTWHRSMSSLSSSSRNPLGGTSRDDTDGLTGNIFGGVYMNAGSHASTLDRLYAWERKLYDEVKAGSAICRQYDEKCRQLRHQESRGESQMSIDKTRAVVKDLHSRILVAIQRIDMISKNIEDLRDKELQPQLEELIGSLTRMWATMLDCHHHQHEIIKLVSNSGNMKVLIRSESQIQAALVLQVELKTLYVNFQTWIASHRSYLQSLNSWLLKCVKSLRRRKKSRRRKEADIPITNYAVAPIFKTCENWIKLFDVSPTKDHVSPTQEDVPPTKEDMLPIKELEEAIKGLAADIGRSVPRQERRRGNPKLTFSLSHSGMLSGEMERGHRNDPPTDLESRLETFIGKLEEFSSVSLQRYVTLKKDIDKAKEDYEKWNK